MSMVYQLAALADQLNLPNKSTGIGSSNIETILSLVFTVATLLSIIFIVIGAFKYVISGGDPSGTASAKNTVLYAVIGLAVTLSSYVIFNFIITRL